MEKVKDIETVLDFYVRVNGLKEEIMDESNNYSMANHLFGSMILATAIDSEFKEAKDLGKIYRMLLLTEIADYDPDYNFENMKMGKQFISEIIEARNWETENGRLVLKYRMLDCLLTDFIKMKGNNLDLTSFIREGSSIVASLCDASRYDCEEIFKYYYHNFRLKDKVRSAWNDKHWNIKSKRVERVSEHVIGTLGLAIGLTSEFGYDVDLNKVSKILVTHETGEAIAPDYTPFDGKTPEQKIAIEHKALREVIGRLKDRESLIQLLFDFDDKKTNEDLFSFLCDKMELNLQARIYQDKGVHHSLDDQKNNIVFKNPSVQQMIKNGAIEPFEIFYEWDKSIFENNKQFPEFEMMFKRLKQREIIASNYAIRGMSYSFKNK